MRSIYYKKLRTPKNIAMDMDKIIIDLERNGRSISRNPNATRALSKRLRVPKQYGEIIFAKDRTRQRTVIMIHPKKKLVRSGPRIKIIDR